MQDWQRRLNEIGAIADPDARLAAYAELVAAVPRAAPAWSNYAIDLAAAGRWIDARRAVLRAFAEDPTLRRSGAPTAQALARLGDCDLVAELVATPAHVVYHAVRTADHRPVLIRTLPDRTLIAAAEQYGHHEVLTRVRRVAHVVRALGTAEAPPGTIHQLLEHVRGQIVSVLVPTIAGDPRRGAEIVADTARALEAARRDGVVGFELRPEFLMRADDRGDGIVSLGPLTAEGDRSWAAPEELDGDDGGDPARVYRLGLLFYLTSGAALPLADLRGARALTRPPSWASTPSAYEAVRTATAAAPDQRPSLAELTELLAAIAGDRAAAPEVGGRRIGGLRLVRAIGEGRTAVVWEAEDDDGNRRAVKILHRHAAADGETRLRFVNEAKLAGGPAHPGVIQIFGDGTTADGEHYLVMELAAGSLAERLRAEPLSVASTVAVGIEIAESMASVHGLRPDKLTIVHRDLKPSNLLMTDRDADPPRIKICDFGVAKLQGEPVDVEIPLTRQGSLLGTPQYMAPEQWMMVDDLDGRADVYALGVVLFECLTGERPFRGKNDYELQQEHLHAAVPPLAERGVPPALATIVVRMLRKDRRERFQSMAEVASALRAWRASLDAPTIGPTPDGPSDRVAAARNAALRSQLVPLRWRNWYWTASGVGVLAVAAIVVGIVTRDPAPSGPAAPLEPRVLPHFVTELSKDAEGRYLLGTLPCRDTPTDLATFVFEPARAQPEIYCPRATCLPDCITGQPAATGTMPPTWNLAGVRWSVELAPGRDAGLDPTKVEIILGGAMVGITWAAARERNPGAGRATPRVADRVVFSYRDARGAERRFAVSPAVTGSHSTSFVAFMPVTTGAIVWVMSMTALEENDGTIAWLGLPDR